MSNPLNSIDRDIFQGQVSGIAEEMSRGLRRSAYSPIIWDMYDYSCAILTTRGEILAQAETIPAQLGTMASAFAGVTAVMPLDRWDDGDVVVCNDPYRGCAHTSDITLFSPIVSDGETIAVAATIAHHIDVGGPAPGTVSLHHRELFSEGLVFPPLKLIEKGAMNESVLSMFKSNIRYVDASLGDLYAQISGCRIAERRIVELAKRYGNRGFAELVDASLTYGEMFTRNVSRSLQPGVFVAETLIEDGVASPEPILLRATLNVGTETLAIDFSGSSAQRQFGLNCPWASTVSMALYAAKCILAPEQPSNGGMARALDISAPAGCVLNPAWPGAVSGRHLTQQAVADVVLKAFALAAPERGVAGSQIAFPTMRFEGVDDRPGRVPKRFFVADILGGGAGASPGVDGLNAIDTHGSNCALMSAEIMETVAPIRVNRCALVADSGGRGTYRGGLALERDYEVLASTITAAAKLQQLSTDTAPRGYAGGDDGSTGFACVYPDSDRQTYVDGRGESRSYVKGDVIRLRGAGGGGYGDPTLRSAALLESDVHEGYATAAIARP